MRGSLIIHADENVARMELRFEDGRELERVLDVEEEILRRGLFGIGRKKRAVLLIGAPHGEGVVVPDGWEYLGFEEHGGFPVVRLATEDYRVVCGRLFEGSNTVEARHKEIMERKVADENR